MTTQPSLIPAVQESARLRLVHYVMFTMLGFSPKYSTYHSTTKLYTPTYFRMADHIVAGTKHSHFSNLEVLPFNLWDEGHGRRHDGGVGRGALHD
jgi:hypothetical protein